MIIIMKTSESVPPSSHTHNPFL